jgi:hypothetical protein
MQPKAECDMAAGIPVNIESVRIVKLCRIMVCAELWFV